MCPSRRPLPGHPELPVLLPSLLVLLRYLPLKKRFLSSYLCPRSQQVGSPHSFLLCEGDAPCCFPHQRQRWDA